MNIAIISCKKQKQTYPCPADEMYNKSFIYRAQRDFIKEAYDDYYILSSKYGLIHHTTQIKPYDMSIYKKPTINFDKTQKVSDEVKFWKNVEKQINLLLEQNNTLHFHTSNDYFNPISKQIKNKVKHIKQPKAFGQTQTIYQEALQLIKEDKDLDKCINHITEEKESKYNEEKKWFYHNKFGEYFGKASDLHRKYPNDTDEGTLYQLSTLRIKQHKGWVTDKSLLYLIEEKNGRYKIKKPKPRNPNIDKFFS